MKKFVTLFLIIGSLVSPQLVNAQIYSDLGGGNWNQPTTWIGGTVPTAGDDVIIQSYVHVNVHSSCNKLTVLTPGKLDNSGSSHNLTIYGNLENYGIITSTVNLLNCHIYGNLINNGSFSAYSIKLQEGDQYITLSGGQTFYCQLFEKHTSGTVYANTDLRFYGTSVDFNGHTLVMPDNGLFSVDAGGVNKTVREIIVWGPNTTIMFVNGINVHTSTFENSTIEGDFKVSGYNTFLTGTTDVQGIIENYGSSHTLYINGNIINNGEIRNGTNNLTTDITGDIVNNGIWSNYKISLTGAGAQNMTCMDGVVFSGNYLDRQNGSDVFFLSDMYFQNVEVDFNYSEVIFNEGSYVSFMGIGKYFRDAVITGNNAILSARGMRFQNTTALTLNVSGDFWNYGQMDIYRTVLDGSPTQHLWFAPGSICKAQMFDVNCENLVVETDLEFENTKVDIHNNQMVLPNETTIKNSGYNYYLKRVNCSGETLTLDFSDDAYISDINFDCKVITKGKVLFNSSNIVFNQDFVNHGTLGNSGSSHSIYLNADFYNYGVVMNNYNTLTIYSYGDIFNNGDWDIYRNNITGVDGQNIRLFDDQAINTPSYLHSNLGGNGFQWHLDDVPIPGANASTLILDPVSDADYGLYYCTSSEGQSRDITINSRIEPDFTSDAPAVGSAPLIVNFTDGTGSGFPIVSWFWEFGDGETSNGQNPAHEYSSPGHFDISLTVSDGYTTATITKPDHVFVCQTPEAGFSFEDVCLNEESTFIDESYNLNMDDSLKIRYATGLIDFSSEWGPVNWGAIQTLGEPDVYPVYADSNRAWATLTPNGPHEWIELSYDDPSRISAVWIYENLKPGSVDTVYAKNPSTGLWEILWSGTATPAPLEARIFKVGFPETTFPVSEIRIAMNTGAISYWSEIDAVALVTFVGEFPSDETAYEWDLNNDGHVDFTTKGDVSFTYPDPGVYEVKLRIVNNGVCENEIIKTHSVNTGPEFILGPQDITVCSGHVAMFTSEATMTGTFGVNYQWYGPTGILYGETLQDLKIDPATAANAGEYFVVAYNSCGSDISQTAVLTIQENPTAFAGDDATICEDEVHGLYDAEADHYGSLFWE
ncbi:MAG: hypothetical protein B6I19_08060, partial [Bacteroidetes bacterium 4572_114]